MAAVPSSAVLRAIVRHYRLRADERVEEDNYWRAEEDLAEAIHRSVGLETPWGKHSHQQLLPPDVLLASRAKLLADQERLRGTNSFDALLSQVEMTLDPVRGAGEMLDYDAADRIGLCLRREPEAVYLHNGTRRGAQALIDGLGGNVRSISREQLPPEFHELSNREIEDILCIYCSVFTGESPVPDDMERSCGRKPRKRRSRRC